MLAIGLLEESVGGTDITWLLWVALGFFAVMVVVGWLSSRKKKLDEEPTQPAHDEHEGHGH